MKKWILITSVLSLLAIILVITFTSNKEDYVQLDLVKNSNPQAAEILYNYVLKSSNITEEKAKNIFNFSKENFYAVNFDLNDDGEEEIIGFANTMFFCGTAGCGLDILQKDKNRYKNIAFVININYFEPIFISNKKTNGYRNIKFYSMNSEKLHIAKIKSGKYTNKEQTEELEQVFREHSKVLR